MKRGKKGAKAAKAWIGRHLRRYHDTPHRSFRPTPRRAFHYSLKGVKEGWRLIIETVVFARTHVRFFAVLMLLYAGVGYLLVGGLSQVDFVQFKESAKDISANALDSVTTALSMFGAALTGAFRPPAGEVQQFFAAFLLLLFWLVTIWAVRMLSAGKPAKVRDALYNAGAPMISSLAVMAVMALQLIPAALGFFAVSVATNEQWIHGGVEAMAYAAAALLLSVLSLYWLSGSIVAIAIVALPGMYPMEALATARTLVTGKRWGIALRVVAMVVIQLLAWAVVLIPLFMLDQWLSLSWLPLIPVALQLLGGFSVIFSSVYMYKLYRSLL